MWQWQRPAFQSDLPPGFGQAIALGASVCSSVRWTQQWCLPRGCCKKALPAVAWPSAVLVPAEGRGEAWGSGSWGRGAGEVCDVLSGL